MTKKNRTYLKSWQLHTFAITFRQLLEQEGKNTGNSGNNTADDTGQHNDTRTTLTAKPTLETSFVYEDTTTAGYMKAIVRLIKQAFFHKKGVHFFLIGYRAQTKQPKKDEKV
ncbi:MAG: hypothetical protein J6I60_01870 [Bacteroidaceae bacterium]|nr:hypothetical protein [Bacteroidaceae bacterium]